MVTLALRICSIPPEARARKPGLIDKRLRGLSPRYGAAIHNESLRPEGLVPVAARSDEFLKLHVSYFVPINEEGRDRRALRRDRRLTILDKYHAIPGRASRQQRVGDP